MPRGPVRVPAPTSAPAGPRPRPPLPGTRAPGPHPRGPDSATGRPSLAPPGHGPLSVSFLPHAPPASPFHGSHSFPRALPLTSRTLNPPHPLVLHPPRLTFPLNLLRSAPPEFAPPPSRPHALSTRRAPARTGGDVPPPTPHPPGPRETPGGPIESCQPFTNDQTPRALMAQGGDTLHTASPGGLPFEVLDPSPGYAPATLGVPLEEHLCTCPARGRTTARSFILDCRRRVEENPLHSSTNVKGFDESFDCKVTPLFF